MTQEKDYTQVGFNAGVLKRLMRYAKPYRFLFFVCLVMISLSVVTDLARPYLIKLAVDRNLTSYDQPMRQSAQPLSDQSIAFEGAYYTRLGNQEVSLSSPTTFQILRQEGQAYLIQGAIQRPASFTIRGNQAFSGQKNFLARPLSQAQYQQFRAGDYQGLRTIASWFFGLLLLGFFMNYGQTYLLSYIGQHVIQSMRVELFGHVLSLPLSFFNRNPVGRLVTRLTNDLENLNELYSAVLVSFFKDIFILGGIIIMMLRMSRSLSVVLLIAMPVVAAVSFVFRLYSRKAYREVRTRLAVINSSLSENISGMKIIRMFAREEEKRKQFEAINQDHMQASLRELFIFAVFRPSISFIYSLTQACLLWFGGGQVIQGQIEFGTLFAFLSYLEMFFQPINDLSEKFNITQSALASAERIFDLLDEQNPLQDPPCPPLLQRAKGRIDFDNVWFAYEEANWVLKGVSFVIEPGQTAAFVGATGSGKTTILSLLARFYDIQKGTIYLDGIDIKTLAKADLRRNIATVMQDVYLFGGTFTDNIRLNNQDIPFQAVRQAAKDVNADGFISNLEHGYETQVEAGGATLSAGEKQLIVFARALVFDPPILVLDEATSNIDTPTELLIQEAISRLSKQRTTLVVAHRLSTIRQADQILVMNHGCIVERGNHTSLLAQKGRYFELYQVQAARQGAFETSWPNLHP